VHSIGLAHADGRERRHAGVHHEIAFDFSTTSLPRRHLHDRRGTGRFARAIGVGTLRNVAMQGNAGFVIIQEGWISYEASDRGADK